MRTLGLLASGAPGGQPYSLVDPATFVEREAGITVATLPVPATSLLLASALVLLAWLRRGPSAGAANREGRLLKSPSCLGGVSAVALLAALLSGCGGDSEPASNAPPQKVQLAAPLGKLAEASPIALTGMTKLAEKRISRTVFDYTYQVGVRNNSGADAAAVNVLLTKAPVGTQIMDGAVAVGPVAAGASVTPSDVIVLRIDRSIPFDTAGLVWDISSAAAIQLEPVEPSEVYVLSLADLGFPKGAEKVSVSGAVSDVLLKDGTLRFSTPGDTGADQHAEFLLVSDGATTALQLLITSSRPGEVLAHVEPLRMVPCLPLLPG